MNRLLLCTLLLVFSIGTSAQSPLQTYIQEALDNNIALQRKHLSYEKSLQALKEAKANFLPQFSLEARYSVARGGRTIDFPLGDLMNPVYQNLNLINQLGQSTTPDYPVIPTYENIDNVAINFLRREEQETKFRAVMPVFNNAIWVNQNVKENLAEVDRINIDTYKKELSKEVKLGYFNYAKALEAQQLYNNTLKLVQENLRTTQRLFENHKLTKDAVYLAEAQVREVERQIAEADKNLKVAQAYFNFLLNKPYETPIQVGDDPYPIQEVGSVDLARDQAEQARDELQQFNYFLAIADQNVDLNRGALLPEINLVADYGIQGTRYTFRSEDDYFMGSLVMSWKLFQPANKSKIQQAKIDKLERAQQKEELKQQIGLQVVQAWYDVEAAQKVVTQTDAEKIATQSAFRLVNKRFLQGQANLVEWMDARTRMTNAEQGHIIARFDYQGKVAVLERAIGQ